jgi:hypothetical protein
VATGASFPKPSNCLPHDASRGRRSCGWAD